MLYVRYEQTVKPLPLWPKRTVRHAVTRDCGEWPKGGTVENYGEQVLKSAPGRKAAVLAAMRLKADEK